MEDKLNIIIQLLTEINSKLSTGIPDTNPQKKIPPVKKSSKKQLFMQQVAECRETRLIHDKKKAAKLVEPYQKQINELTIRRDDLREKVKALK